MSMKPNSRLRRRSKAVPVLGAAGLSLSLASGAYAAAPASQANVPTLRPASSHEITLGEEEITDVSLATFRIVDKENPQALRPRLRLAIGACGCGCGCGGCGGCWGGTYPPWWELNAPPSYQPGEAPAPHRYTHARRHRHRAHKEGK